MKLVVCSGEADTNCARCCSAGVKRKRGLCPEGRGAGVLAVLK